MCVMKKDGALEAEAQKGRALKNEVIRAWQGRNSDKKSNKKTGATKTKRCPRGCPSGGEVG